MPWKLNIMMNKYTSSNQFPMLKYARISLSEVWR